MTVLNTKLIDASPRVKEKIKKDHDVDWEEIEEAFGTSTPPYPTDSRTKHKTKPETQYFISETCYERLLKVCFIIKGDIIWVKTAYDPDENDIVKYMDNGGKIGWL